MTEPILGPTSEPKPAAQGAIDELAQGAQSPEDKAVVDEWQRELDQQRAQVLGDATKPAEPLVHMPDGTITTQTEVQDAQHNDQQAPASYDGAGRRA
jgi:hypothetical protein